jgi:hypothetical protein
VLLGQGDTEQVDWSGSVAVTPGEVVELLPWRLRGQMGIEGKDAWKARTVVLQNPDATKKANAAKKLNPGAAQYKKGAGAGKKAQGGGSPVLGPAGIIVRVKAPGEAVLTIKTSQGEARMTMAELAAGGLRRALDGRVVAQIVPNHAVVSAGEGQEDVPSACSDGKAGAWVALLDHAPRGAAVSAPIKAEPDSFKDFVPTGGGDRVRLLHFDGTKVIRALDVTAEGRDAWRPAVAVDGAGAVVVVWAENIDGNFDLYMRTLDAKEGAALSDPARLTSDPGTDTDPVLARAGDGRVFVAWQAWREGQADILLAPVAEPGKIVNLSNTTANEWSPSAVALADGGLAVAFDTYRSGSYDVLLARTGPGGADPKVVAVADSSAFEARPSVAVDRRGRVWVAYDERPANWGKDFGIHSGKPGVSLYRDPTVRVRVVEGDQVRDAGDPSGGGPEELRRLNAFPRMTVDHEERPWVLFRHRRENNWRGSPIPVVGALWLEYASARVGDGWSVPTVVPRSDGILDVRPSLVAREGAPALAFYATDGRLHRESTGQGAGGGGGEAAGKKGGGNRRGFSLNNDVFVAALTTTPAGAAAAAEGPVAARPELEPPAHPNEAEDVARLRAYRIQAGGKNYQLLRGEFHRHTEISADGGGDGALEDMWRYGLDVGALDWIGCGDHDNGNGREYTWWLTQKTTDLYHNAPTFNPMFTYERSVNYPGGHRNVMFPYRGVRTLPRLQAEAGGLQIDVSGKDLDAAMLYKYLRELNGICAAHTTATDMGTDWRANDPIAEPIVEIYQGDRDSAEYLGAPRAARSPADAAGGWRPLGMVWNALAMQYKLGFQSSSDHISTHMSYAVAIAEEPTRAAIFDAFQQRHCYAATDNILLDVRSGEHLMGDAFTQAGPVTLRVRAHGTGPIARIDVIKDFRHVYTTEPRAARVDFAWTDEKPGELPTSWYYVRVIQEDGEIAWGSPIWVNRGR